MGNKLRKIKYLIEAATGDDSERTDCSCFNDKIRIPSLHWKERRALDDKFPENVTEAIVEEKNDDNLAGPSFCFCDEDSSDSSVDYSVERRLEEFLKSSKPKEKYVTQNSLESTTKSLNSRQEASKFTKECLNSLEPMIKSREASKFSENLSKSLKPMTKSSPSETTQFTLTSLGQISNSSQPRNANTKVSETESKIEFKNKERNWMETLRSCCITGDCFTRRRGAGNCSHCHSTAYTYVVHYS